MFKRSVSLIIIFFAGMLQHAFATDYYVNALSGKDDQSGTSPEQAFKSIDKINETTLKPGDRVFFAAGHEFKGELRLVGLAGQPAKGILISSYGAANGDGYFFINAKGKPNGILIKDCQYVTVKNARIEADGYEGEVKPDDPMRVGVMITSSPGKISKFILLDSLDIRNIYFENKGFVRGANEVKTENGTQCYGWGIRLMATERTAQITEVDIRHVRIRDVSHTGIKLTGAGKNISWIRIYENDVAYTGGPGMQMSEVKNIHVHHNKVDRSGSANDSRKWGRGSGLWTWSASDVVIEHNSFTNANGPGDSAGAHIDYNCDHVILQYNLSANNAGGFCEILGNNYNCAYRYNVSVNDGHRIKGENGAFQEGKIFWLSGYQGNQMPRKGPVNSYFYNNTIYVDSSITARVAIDGTSRGILIANNIFYVVGKSQMVLGDQYKADNGKDVLDGPILFKNNLLLTRASWPENSGLGNTDFQTGNPMFSKPGGTSIADYIPRNAKLIKSKGMVITPLQGDFLGLPHGMNPDKDILGNPITGLPPMGAIVPK
jgi:hypothetical protein